MGIAEIVYSFFGLSGVALLIWATRSIKRWGAADAKREEAEKDRDEAIENEKRLAGRPNTVVDIRDRLQSWKRKL